MLAGISAAEQAQLAALRAREEESKPKPQPSPRPSNTTTSQDPHVSAASAAATAALARVDADAAGLKDGKVTPAQYYRDDQHLVTVTEQDLAATYTNLTSKACYLNPNATTEAAVAAQHPKDREWVTAVKAAAIVRQVTQAQGSTAQIDTLEKSLPAGVDPSIKRLVLGDSAVRGAINDFVNKAAAQVAQADTSYGPLAAADTLQQLVSAIPQGADSAQLAALVINKSMPTIRTIVAALPIPQAPYQGGVVSRLVGQPVTPNAQQENQQIFLDLSQAVEAAAAGGNTSAGTYDTKDIQTAVTGVAQLIATHPSAVPGYAFRAAVGQGYATLALATAAQIKQLPPTRSNNTQLSGLLSDITAGLHDFQATVNQATTALTQSLAPIQAQGGFGPVLTQNQTDGGINAMINGLPVSRHGPAVAAVPGLKAAVDAALKNIAALGYRITRTDEAVTFYQHALAGTPGYGTVQTADATLVTGPNGIAFQLASPQSRERVIEQTMRQAFGSVGHAQLFSTGAQTLGDLTEFLAEESIKGNASASGSLALLDNAGNQLLLDPNRIGHTPAALAWLAGGALQAGLTNWIVDNSHPGGPASNERKLLTLTIVGGFAGLHSVQALAAGTRWIATLLNPKAADGSRYVKAGGLIDNLTRLTVEPTVGLIRGLTVLMGLASIADVTSLSYDFSGLQSYPGGALQTGVNAGAHSLNFLADVTLLRLQARGWAQQALGKIMLTEPATHAAFSNALKTAMLQSLGVKVPVPAPGANSPALVSAVETFLEKNSTLATTTKELLAKLGTRASLQDLAGTWARTVLADRGNPLRAVLTRSVRGSLEHFGDIVLKTPQLNEAFQSAFSAAKLTALGVDVKGPVNPAMVQAIKAFLGPEPTALLDSTKLLGAISTTGQQSLAASWALEDPEYGSGLVAKLATSGALDRLGNAISTLTKVLNPKIWGQVLSVLKSRLASEGASALPAGLEAAITSELAGGGGEAVATEGVGEAVAGLSNPIGWAVNIIYLGTTLGTTFFNQYGAIQAAQNNEYDFLRGAGLDDAHAAAMKPFGFLNGVPASSGFVAAYEHAGGDPKDFPAYVNSLHVDDLKKALAAFSELNSKAVLPKTSSQDYWTLPLDPNQPAQRAFDPNLTYNPTLKAWDDKSLNVYFMDGVWFANDSTGNFYDPTNQTLNLHSPYDITGYSVPVHLPPGSLEGIRAWFAFHNVSPPPPARA